MRIAILLVLAACGAAPAKPSDCPEAGRVLVKATRDCSDMRAIASGYWEMTILDGPRRGETLIASYGPAHRFTLANFAIGTPDFAVPVPTSGENSCSQMAPLPAYAGGIRNEGMQGYPRESEARAAFASKRCPR